MRIFGLSVLDVGIILLYLAVILWLGRRSQRRTKDTGDFYIAGRRLGKFYQFFLNFGHATNADQAVAVAREVYRQGIGGMWIQYLVLFLTPFYWFTSAFYRRARQVTLGDFYSERFRSKFLGASFAVFTLVMAVIGGGVGFMVAGKTVEALTPKPAELYTVAETHSVEMFREYQALKQKLDLGLTVADKARYDELNDRFKKGELRSFISHIDPLVVYLVYGVIVAVYTMMGGFIAAAFTDVIQGFLIVIFSVMLIPLALNQIGGFAGLHARVPDFMFNLFGSVTTSEYAWYTILAMVLANLVSIIASAPMMQTASAARDENAARFGMIAGMFFKRFLMIFWALAGLLAVGLFKGQLHDPDLIWGYMTLHLLFPGAVGLMLAGILAANMSTLSAASVTYSALFIRNLYQPFVSPKSERHLLFIGRIVIAVTLAGGIGAALFVGNLLDLFKYFISMPAVFGASIWLGFIWRRLTRWAVIIQIFVCFGIYAVIPNVFQSWDWAKSNAAFLRETRPRVVRLVTEALQEDVDAGRARAAGEKIVKPYAIEPTAVFYEKVVRVRPEDPDSPRIGIGRFEAEVWVLSWLGIDFTRFTKAQLVATRFFFDALFPFVLLFLLSRLTRPLPKSELDSFFAKVHTPVQPIPADDERAVEEARAQPEKFLRRKLWPRSNWEVMKPGRADILGFGGTWVLVGVIILLLWLMVTIR
ncbi:MAG: transporter [Candidatus Aminicenantes bacterium RBG_19FT_COMBO_58_17]|jgi:SSS family solute:Na+ symporter|nr:MAG: transporter [Candidatus Aminicenantes bacterium RBG_19FT_COMBO_58_17]